MNIQYRYNINRRGGPQFPSSFRLNTYVAELGGFVFISSCSSSSSFSSYSHTHAHGESEYWLWIINVPLQSLHDHFLYTDSSSSSSCKAYMHALTLGSVTKAASCLPPTTTTHSSSLRDISNNNRWIRKRVLRNRNRQTNSTNGCL